MITDDEADAIIGKLRWLDDVHPETLRDFANWAADKWERLERTEAQLTAARQSLSQLLLSYLRLPAVAATPAATEAALGRLRSEGLL